MITLHRLGRFQACFQLNPDLIVSIESTPDTVITLTNTTKVVVSDTPEQISEAVRAWRAHVLVSALHESEEGADQDGQSAGAPDTAAVARQVLAASVGHPA